MADERPRPTASKIEALLLAELQKLHTLHDTQSVTVRPTAARRVGHGSWTGSNRKWDLSRASSPT